MSKRKIIKKLKKENRDLKNKIMDIDLVNQTLQKEVGFVLKNRVKEIEDLHNKMVLEIFERINRNLNNI